MPTEIGFSYSSNVINRKKPSQQTFPKKKKNRIKTHAQGKNKLTRKNVIHRNKCVGKFISSI